jgi:hypothetical protein
MSIEGTQLASAMLSIHTAEMDQAERCPDWRRSSRLERHAVLHGGGNRAICWLGCLFERFGHRLHEYAMPRPDGWAAEARNRAEANPGSVVQLG